MKATTAEAPAPDIQNCIFLNSVCCINDAKAISIVVVVLHSIHAINKTQTNEYKSKIICIKLKLFCIPCTIWWTMDWYNRCFFFFCSLKCKSINLPVFFVTKNALNCCQFYFVIWHAIILFHEITTTYTFITIFMLTGFFAKIAIYQIKQHIYGFLFNGDRNFNKNSTVFTKLKEKKIKMIKFDSIYTVKFT